MSAPNENLEKMRELTDLFEETFEWGRNVCPHAPGIGLLATLGRRF